MSFKFGYPNDWEISHQASIRKCSLRWEDRTCYPYTKWELQVRQLLTTTEIWLKMETLCSKGYLYLSQFVIHSFSVKLQKQIIKAIANHADTYCLQGLGETDVLLKMHGYKNKHKSAALIILTSEPHCIIRCTKGLILPTPWLRMIGHPPLSSPVPTSKSAGQSCLVFWGFNLTHDIHFEGHLKEITCYICYSHCTGWRLHHHHPLFCTIQSSVLISMFGWIIKLESAILPVRVYLQRAYLDYNIKTLWFQWNLFLVLVSILSKT